MAATVEVKIRIPRVLAVRVKRLGVDIESLVVERIIRELGLDPREEAEARLELALQFLEEGRRLVDRDPVQASEKLYKAAEEAVKALSARIGLEDVLSRVRERGRWTVTDLEKAVERLSVRFGDWFEETWDRALVLHVWGFHEARLDGEAVRRRLPYVEKIVDTARRIIGGGSSGG